MPGSGTGIFICCTKQKEKKASPAKSGVQQEKRGSWCHQVDDFPVEWPPGPRPGGTPWPLGVPMQARVSQTSRRAAGNKEQRNILWLRIRAARGKILGENAQSQGQLSPKPEKKKRRKQVRRASRTQNQSGSCGSGTRAETAAASARRCKAARPQYRSFLKELTKERTRVHLLTGRNDSGNVLQDFGRCRIPRPARSLLLAKACCIQVGHLDCRVSRCCRSTFASCVNKGSLPLRASDGQVTCSRPALKGRDKDVRWPPTVHFRPLWKKKATALLFRLQTSSVSPTANEISESMMPMVSFAPSNADSSMQGKLVKNAMRARTPPVIEGFG